MKLSISNPQRDTQMVLNVESHIEKSFIDKQIGDQVEGKVLGTEWEGYLLEITGGCDKQGFPMKPGVMCVERVRLLLKKGDKGFRCTRDGLRRRKSVRGCIVSEEIGILYLKTLREGPHTFIGFTDVTKPILKGPKRASKIRRLFNLSKTEMDLEKYVVGHKKTKKNGEVVVIKPKIRRLVTEKKKAGWERRITERIARQRRSKEKKLAYRTMIKEREAAGRVYQ